MDKNNVITNKFVTSSVAGNLTKVFIPTEYYVNGHQLSFLGKTVRSDFALAKKTLI